MSSARYISWENVSSPLRIPQIVVAVNPAPFLLIVSSSKSKLSLLTNTTKLTSKGSESTIETILFFP